MRKAVVGLLVLCVALAVLRMAVVALAVALLLALLISFVIRPRETILYLVSLTLMGVASTWPTPFSIGVGIIVLAGVWAGARRKSGDRLLLTDDRGPGPPEPEGPDRDLLG